MNTPFTQYHPATGEIVAGGTVAPDTLASWFATSVAVLLDVWADPATHYVTLAEHGPVLSAYTPDELAARNALPEGWVWKMPERIALDVRTLADLKARAIARTYGEVDAVYEAAIGRRTTEYTNAEIAARAYKAAGFVGPVSEYISGHAEHNPTGVVQSYEWATQQIIERADAFKWAELQLRNMRFSSQAAMRAAATNAELDAAVAVWDGFIAWLRTLLAI